MSERELERILAEEPDEAKVWRAMEEYLKGGDHMTENRNLYAVLVCDEYCDGDNVAWIKKGADVGVNEAMERARDYKKTFGYRRAKIKRVEV